MVGSGVGGKNMKAWIHLALHHWLRLVVCVWGYVGVCCRHTLSLLVPTEHHSNSTASPNIVAGQVHLFTPV